VKKADLHKLLKNGGGPGNAADFVVSQQVTFDVREMAEGSPFAGRFVADRWKAYIEVEICTSLPAIAGPTGNTGNFLGYHPAVLARCHNTLLHQQTNQHHLIKNYNPGQILNDAIVGSVVATHFPEPPDGGWVLPAEKADAVAIRACAVVFRQAENAARMLEEITKKSRKWSISIEVVPSNFESLGLYVPSQKQIVPLLEADDHLLECIEKDDRGRLLVRKCDGEQIVLAMGATDGSVEFQGFAYTPHPASPDDHIVQVLASGGVLDHEQLQQLVSKCWPGAKILEVQTEGRAKLKGAYWSRETSLENPALFIELASKGRILKNLSEIREDLAPRKNQKS